MPKTTRRRLKPESPLEPENNEEDEQEELLEKAKLRKNKKQPPSDSLEDGDLDDAQQRETLPDFDPDTFGDHPLLASMHPKLGQLASDWNGINGKTKEVIQQMTSAAAVLEETTQDDDDKERMAQLDSSLRDLIDFQVEIQAHQESVEEIKQRVVRGEQVDNCVGQYVDFVKEVVGTYRKKTVRQKYQHDPEYAAFRQGIWEVNHPGNPMPPITAYLERGEDDNDSDDELIMGGMTQTYKCILTLTMLQDPMTSKTCGHSYSRTAIQEFLGHSKKQCPATGCNQIITFADFYANKELEKQAKAAARRERQREKVEEVEEVVD